jgi:hypothetical protein
VDPTHATDKDDRASQPKDLINLAGTTQLSAIQTHTHNYVSADDSTMPPTVGAEGPATAFGKKLSEVPSPDPKSVYPLLVSSSETRPLNMALYFLIKAI